MSYLRVAAILVAGLCFVPASTAAPKPVRTVTVPYQAGTGQVGTDRMGVIVGSLTLPAGPEDRLDLSLEDASGLPVVAEIVQSTGLAFICGETEHPIRIEPNYPVTVRTYTGKCLDGTPAATTTGTIEATFSWTGPKIVDEAGYSLSAPDRVGYDGTDVGLGTVTFLPAHRPYAHVEIEDVSGRAVVATVSQNGAIVARVCGKSNKPIAVNPKLPLVVRVWVSTCDDGSPSLPTNGTIRATFLRKA